MTLHEYPCVLGGMVVVGVVWGQVWIGGSLESVGHLKPEYIVLCSPLTDTLFMFFFAVKVFYSQSKCCTFGCLQWTWILFYFTKKCWWQRRKNVTFGLLAKFVEWSLSRRRRLNKHMTREYWFKRQARNPLSANQKKVAEHFQEKVFEYMKQKSALTAEFSLVWDWITTKQFDAGLIGQHILTYKSLGRCIDGSAHVQIDVKLRYGRKLQTGKVKNSHLRFWIIQLYCLMTCNRQIVTTALKAST